MKERKGRYIIEFKDIPAKRGKMAELPPEERVKGFQEAEVGFERAQALAEASRCLACRRCIGCALCRGVCEANAIDYSQTDSTIELESDAIIFTMAEERVPVTLKEKFGYGNYLNVLTFPEFEQLLSDSGPYLGMVLRPYDGEIPQRIAFISDETKANDRLLTLALKGALAARKKIPNLEVQLFFPEGTKAETVRSLANTSKVSLRSSEDLAVSEDAETKKLIITANAGKKKAGTEEFDMVIVLVASFELPNYLKELTGKLGIVPAGQKLQESADTSLSATTKEGIFLYSLSIV